MEETWVQSLGGEDPLEKGMATHSSILAWRIPWTEEPGGLQSTGSQSWTQLTDFHTFRKTNKDLLYNTENSTQNSVMTYKGKEPKKVDVCVTDSLCCIPETNTTL